MTDQPQSDTLWNWLRIAAKAFGEIAALASAVALACSYCLTLGYLTQFKARTIWIVAFADYLPTAAAMLPIVMAIFVVFAMMRPFQGHFNYGLNRLVVPEKNPGYSPSRIAKATWLRISARHRIAIFFGGIGAILAGLSTVRPSLFPLSGLAAVVMIVAGTTEFMALVEEKHRLSLFLSSLALQVPCFVFSLGAGIASMQTDCHGNTVQIRLRSGEANGCLVWSGSRGVLLASDRGSRFVFYSWDSVSQIVYR